jgi:hypothetical protein
MNMCNKPESHAVCEGVEASVVHVIIEGGVIQDIQVPPGVRVIVRDYDTNSEASERLKRDDEGDDYIETIWE